VQFTLTTNSRQQEKRLFRVSPVPKVTARLWNAAAALHFDPARELDVLKGQGIRRATSHPKELSGFSP
jgi:hypothetical protein